MAGLAARPGLWIAVAAVSTVPLATSIYMAPRLSLTNLTSLLGLKQPGGYWRLLAIIFALLNLKSLPFGWHYRLTRALLTHVSLFRSRCPPAPPMGSLFAPIITSTRCSLLEMDYNLHKSNSTYFSDLDISRMHLVSCLFKRGLHKLHFKTVPPLLQDQKPGRFGIYFGGVQASFRREIKPGQNVEIWSRVLAWDRKWLYIVSHYVEAGRVRPSGFWLQPERKGAGLNIEKGENGHVVGVEVVEGKKKVPNKAIMATAISKYVFKQGRITIPPELALQGAELLPSKPEGWSDSSPEAPIVDEELELGPPLEISVEKWNWAAVEKERLRGMKLAHHLTALDDALHVWSGSEGMALGEF